MTAKPVSDSTTVTHADLDALERRILARVADAIGRDVGEGHDAMPATRQVLRDIADRLKA